MNKLDRFEEEELGNALAYVNAYANVSASLYNYECANSLYWLKHQVLNTFSTPKSVFISLYKPGYRLYATYKLGGRGFLLPLEPEEAEDLSKYLPLEVSTYLGELGAKDALGASFKDLKGALEVLYNALKTTNFPIIEDAFEYMMEESSGKTLEALKAQAKEEEEQAKEEEEAFYDLTEEDFEFDEES